MTQRLLVASLGIAFVLGLASTGQAQRRSRNQTAPAKESSEQTSAGADQRKDSSQQAADQSRSQDSKDKAETAKKKQTIETATLGGGCFWCMEAQFERIPGVKNVVSGFSGGHVPNPTYEMVCTGLTGHAEVIQIQFDPAVISYEKLLNYFWITHDPTTVNSQGPDYGTQYRSIILYHSEEQKDAAIKSYKAQMAHRKRKSPLVTQIVPFVAFFPADAHHQDYYRNNPFSAYCIMYIEPKVHKLRKKLH
ncbi:MAG: peptide-methionine (S)-S-oxide reductase MsrA [Isosphaeraceae bacterium]